MRVYLAGRGSLRVLARRAIERSRAVVVERFCDSFLDREEAIDSSDIFVAVADDDDGRIDEFSVCRAYSVGVPVVVVSRYDPCEYDRIADAIKCWIRVPEVAYDTVQITDIIDACILGIEDEINGNTADLGGLLV